MPETKNILVELSKYNEEWLTIAYTFLQNKQDAEDLVQDFYVRLHKYNVELNNIRYKNGINRYFVYQTIRNMALDFLKTKNKVVLTGLDFLLTSHNGKYVTYNSVNEYKTAEQKLYNKIDRIMATWNQYDRVLFECYMYSGLSYRQIAYGTDKSARLISNHKFLGLKAVKRGNNISVSSMFNTIKSCKIKLKEAIGKDFEHYFNNQFDKIL